MQETNTPNLTKILDGKIVRDEIAERLKRDIADFKVRPHLVILQVGDLPESNAYIRSKKLLGEKLGCTVTHSIFPESMTTIALVGEIEKLNLDSTVHGIIVQLPLPSSMDVHTVIEAIDPKKDVDGLTGANLKLMWEGKEDGIVPATAQGIITLLDYYKIPIEGKRAVVVGRSKLVGKPVALALLNRNATVTICHRKTVNLADETKRAHILIVAAGSPGLIGKNHINSDQIIIDVGMTLVDPPSLEALKENSKQVFVGDVDFEAVNGGVSAITPVPGGVGPMTVVTLFANLVKAYKIQTGE